MTDRTKTRPGARGEGSMERDFTDVLTDLDFGKVGQQLTSEIRKVALAVLDTRKVGKVTLTLDLKPDGKTVSIGANVKATIPAPAMERTVFFVDQNGTLRQDNPAQPPLRHVPLTPPTPLRVPGAFDPNPDRKD